MSLPKVRSIPARLIVAGDNDRTVFGDSDLQGLADSIRKDGLLQPITVRPRLRCHDPECGAPLKVGQTACPECGASEPERYYEIVAGERRFRACCLLNWRRIPAIVRQLTDEQASSAMLAENIHRKDIDPLDEARAYQKRIDSFGWSSNQVAKAAKVPEKRVRARLCLLQILPEAQHMIRSGQMGVQFGECLAPLDTNRQRIAMRYLTTTERPLLREFRAVVGKLLSEQAQNAMFDLSVFVAQALDEHAAARAEWKDRHFPVDERLPLMRRVGTVGLSFETYIAELLASEDPYQRAVAPIVGRVYQGMLTGGMAYPPRPERGSPLDRKHQEAAPA